MIAALEPISSPSLKAVFIQRLEELILSGQLPIGEKLPPERVLAQQLGVSRPVVHEGLVELAARGLVTMTPRVGTVVNDYRRQGSLALLSSLVGYGQGALDPALLAGLLDLRRLVESESARLAARERTDDDLAELREIAAAEDRVDGDDVEAVVALDFDFHHRVALASANPMYPMLMKSFEPAAKNLTRQFFARRSVVEIVFGLHKQLLAAVEGRDEEAAAAVMGKLLDHGREVIQDVEAQAEQRAIAGATAAAGR